MAPAPRGRVSSPAFPGPGATLSALTEFLTSNPHAARGASLADKVRVIAQLREVAERLEVQEGGTLQKMLSARPEIRERCIESQMALAILLETTLTDHEERDAILVASPGLAEWVAARMPMFTNPRLRIIIERALAR